jgi:hypothetical protein
MGASGCAYVTRYQGDLASSLSALHRELFDGGETYFREALGAWGLPQPGTLQELWSEQYYEFLGENGTHSILDLPTMARITPLTSHEAQQTFGTERPTRADWNRVADNNADADADGDGGGGASGVSAVSDLVGEMWSGRCVVLFADDVPDEVAFWGASGD